MTEITTGVRSILSSATAYSLFQNLMGSASFRTHFVRDYVRVPPGANVIDIGCGPADILSHLPADVHYWGFDISPRYIASARARHGARGHFFAQPLGEADLASLPPMDVALATGLFHHLDDSTAKTLLEVIRKSLRPSGRLVTLDGAFHPAQSILARWLIAMDRGQHVRTEAGYRELFAHAFPEPKMTILHRAWIPYTHCIAICTRTDGNRDT